MVHTLTIVEPIWSILQKLWSLPIVLLILNLLGLVLSNKWSFNSLVFQFKWSSERLNIEVESNHGFLTKRLKEFVCLHSTWCLHKNKILTFHKELHHLQWTAVVAVRRKSLGHTCEDSYAKFLSVPAKNECCMVCIYQVSKDHCDFASICDIYKYYVLMYMYSYIKWFFWKVL